MPLWLINNRKLVVIGIALVAAGYGGHKVTAWYYAGEIASIHLAHEKAVNEAIVKAQADQRAADDVTLDIAVAHAAADVQIVEKFTTIKEEVSIYVQDTSACITYGLVRVLDAAALGADPKDLLLPAGESNDTCAPVKATDLARRIAGNYEAAHRNSQQLSDLQRWAEEVKRLSAR